MEGSSCLPELRQNPSAAWKAQGSRKNTISLRERIAINADSGKMLAPLQFGRIEFGACDGRKRCRSLNRRGSNFFKHGARHGRVVQCGAGVSGFGIAKKIKLHFVGFGCDVG